MHSYSKGPQILSKRRKREIQKKEELQKNKEYRKYIENLPLPVEDREIPTPNRKFVERINKLSSKYGVNFDMTTYASNPKKTYVWFYEVKGRIIYSKTFRTNNDPTKTIEPYLVKHTLSKFES